MKTKEEIIAQIKSEIQQDVAHGSISASFIALHTLDAMGAVLIDAAGYNDKVMAYTRQIENRPEEVMAFEKLFFLLTEEDGVIDWEGTPEQEKFFERIWDSAEDLEKFLAEMMSSTDRYQG